MVIATTELLLTTVRMKGGIKGMPMVASTSAGVLCRRTFSVPWLSAPVAGTLCSRFSTGVLIRRNHSSLRSRDGGVGFTGAICTIGTYYPTRSSWGCKVKPTNHILSSSTNLTYLLLIGSLMLWKVTRTKKMKDWFAFFLLSVCIWLGLSAAKGNGQAAFLVALCEQAGKVYKVLGHLGLM